MNVQPNPAPAMQTAIPGPDDSQRRSLTGTAIGLSVLVAAFAGVLHAPSAWGATSAGATSLRAALTLSPTSSAMGGVVRAGIGRSAVPAHDSIRSIRLSWGDGTRSVPVRSLASHPTHRYSRPGRYAVKVTITDGRGSSSSARQTELVRAPRGSYDAPYLFGAYGAFSLYVSADGTQVQDVHVPSVALTCNPGGAAITEPIVVDATRLNVNGSFAASGSREVAVPFDGANYPGTLSYAFDGHFSGFDPSGAITSRGELTEKLTFTAAAPLVCTSSRRTWTAARDKQPTQPTSRPAAGSYHGPYLFGVYGDLRFFVSPSGSQLQDVDVPGLALHCTPGTTDVSSGIVLDSVPLTATGSFLATTTRAGNYLGHPATYRYSFRGHVHGVDASGTPRLAGSLLVTMTYSDTADRSCTSNVEPWYATRDAQPRQTSGSAPAGSYSGPYLFGVYGNLRFFVSSDHSELQDIWVPDLQLTCDPGGTTFGNRLLVNDVPIHADGSFAATAHEQGVHLGAVTTFTYVMRGHVHGTDSSGTPRLAGSLLETADYTGTTAESCTSEVQPWSATRDAQPTQTATVPPSGSYRGPYLFGAYGNLSFDVSGDRSQLQDVSIPNVVMSCAPDGSAPSATITIPSVSIAADRSFDGTATEEGTYAGVSATWTYTFNGRFHATGSDGNERAAGALSATLSYTKNGTAFTCTSNRQPWSAELG